MYVDEHTSISKSGKKYTSILLRESYRVGQKVKNRTILNLKKFKPEEIQAIKLALEHKDNLAELGGIKENVELREGPSVGAVWTCYEIARRLGIEKALGTSHAGKLAMWQVIARLIDQGSRLSAVRLAQFHAAADVLGLERGFDENDLYENLAWLCDNRIGIEKRLFKSRRAGAPSMFLYDVTSSYLEGTCNELAAYGYNRDGKKGKKQIVIGLLCDAAGEPVSADVFEGNTQDVATFGEQVKKVSERFGCKCVTMTGDRGMIKSGGIEELSKHGFNYISAITKVQIEGLIKAGVIQFDLFESELAEIKHDGVRYVLRRNPDRSDEMADTRRDKMASVERLVAERNDYLRSHPRAKEKVAQRIVEEKIARLQIDRWLRVKAEDRKLTLDVDEDALREESKFDGCYVIKTDLSDDVADKQVVHDRYKDLAQVEQAFRTMKTAHLEMRPIYVQTEESTRGHVLVVMLAYLIRRELDRAWRSFDLTVEGGIEQLTTLSTTEVVVNGVGSCWKIPMPREMSAKLLQAANVNLPIALPKRNVNVVTRKKLPSRRK